jgi:hypothetical protein
MWESGVKHRKLFKVLKVMLSFLSVNLAAVYSAASASLSARSTPKKQAAYNEAWRLPGRLSPPTFKNRSRLWRLTLRV